MKIDPRTLDRRAAHELLVSFIMPRPIAFVSTIGENGVFNLAPFSEFTYLCTRPAVICVGIGLKRDGRKKDTLRNIGNSKDFVVNVVDETLAEQMNQSSAEYPPDVSEFEKVGLTPVKSDLVKAPMVAESPVNAECRLLQILEFGEPPLGNRVAIGEVVMVHVKDDYWDGEQVDASKFKAVGRLGAQLYCRTTDKFEMKRPYVLG